MGLKKPGAHCEFVLFDLLLAVLPFASSFSSIQPAIKPTRKAIMETKERVSKSEWPLLRQSSSFIEFSIYSLLFLCYKSIMKVLELCRGANDTYFVLYFPKDFPIHSGIFDASQKIDINCKQQICNKEMPKGKNENRSCLNSVS